jgi:hypothetical protein
MARRITHLLGIALLLLALLAPWVPMTASAAPARLSDASLVSQPADLHPGQPHPGDPGSCPGPAYPNRPGRGPHHS